MNKTTCWYCKKEFEYEGEKYQDITCPYCKILNSIYDPNAKEEIKPPLTTHDEYLAQKEEEMKPPQTHKDFEKVAIGEMLTGVINEVMYDQEHKFKGYQGKEDTIQPAVRFKFALDGYKFPHYSRWFKFSYGEKSNLYKIFLTKLVENAKPDMDFDLDLLKGLKVKTLWNENNDFQNLESIFPFESKVKAADMKEATPEADEEIHPVEDMPDEA